MAIHTITTAELTWHDALTAPDEAKRFLKKSYRFHALTYQDLEEEILLAKLDEYPGYLFVVLPLPMIEASGRLTLRRLYLFVGTDYLVSYHPEPIKPLAALFDHYRRRRSKFVTLANHGSGLLLHQLVSLVEQRYAPIMQSLIRELSALEAEVFTESPYESLKDLARIRRRTLALRRNLDSLRQAVARFVVVAPRFFGAELAAYFEDVLDSLDNRWAGLERARDTVDGLHDTVSSLTNARTNEVLKLLTIFSVAMLPLTLFASLYGMNIQLPFAAHPPVVWSLFGGLVLLELATLGYVLWRRRL